MNFFNKFNKLTKRKIDYKKVLIGLGIVVLCITLIFINQNKSRAIFKFDGTGTTINSVVSGEVIKLKCDEMPEETSDANSPSVSLASNMIPVCYSSEEGLWLKADSSNTNVDYQWYSYSGKQWANAVTVTSTNRDMYLNAKVGTEISMEDINTMWVWIPRFSATGDTANYNGGTQSAPGAFNITFVEKETSAHDAFTFGSDPLSGFWMGKFEISHSTLSSSSTVNNLGCNNEICENAKGIEILPNKTPLTRNGVSNYFYAGKSMGQSGNPYGFDKTEDITLDTHMLKNNEWGAVAYLTQSIYGRCISSISCTEVGINNKYMTGYGAPAGSSSSVTNGTYDTSLGMDASTTGNIYGVYDMSGGKHEYVTGVYWDGTKLWSGYNSSSNSGFNGCLGSGCSSTKEDGTNYPSDSKYYNLYTTTDNYTSSCLQHALIETSKWYGDYAYFVNGNYPWFKRGGYYYNGVSSGLFNFYGDFGINSSNVASTRFVLVK